MSSLKLLVSASVLWSAALLEGQVITTIGGADWVFPTLPIAPSNAPLGRLSGVAADSQGNIYLSDRDNCMVLKIDRTGHLSPFAGTGKVGFGGDNGSALSAKFNCPAGLAVDSHDNLYIADTYNHRVRMITPGGIITTIAGTGTRGSFGDNSSPIRAALDTPMGVAVDSAGYIYIADTGNHRVRRIYPAASGAFIETYAGGGDGPQLDNLEPLKGVINYPVALALDLAENLLIVDGPRLRKVIANRGPLTSIAGTGFGDAGSDNGDGRPALASVLLQPSGVTMDTAGNTYIVEAAGLRVRKIGADNIISTLASNGNGSVASGLAVSNAIDFPAGIAFDKTSSALYHAEAMDVQLIRILSTGAKISFAGNGSFRYSGDGPGTGVVLNAPHAVLADGQGNFYIADTLGNRVRRFSKDGGITTLAGNNTAGKGGVPGPAKQAFLNQPKALALDAKHNTLYIADAGNNRILLITLSTGRIDIYGGTQSPGLLNNPSGVAVDAAGSVYIADTGHNRVLRILNDVNNTVQTYAGDGRRSYAGDGDTAEKAGMIEPAGLAFDAQGNLYIADSGDSCVRVVDVLSRIINTLAGTCGVFGYAGDGGTATAARMNTPMGVSLDAAGNVFIADTINNVIRQIKPDKTIVTFAGGGPGNNTGDGGFAKGASLNHPYGVSVDPTGVVAIADTDNNRIREVLSSAPTYQVQPASLKFTAIAGGAPSDPQSITVTSSVPGLAFKASVDSIWLSATPNDSVMPNSVQISVDPSGLDPGSSDTSITILTPTGSPISTKVPITVDVKPPSPRPTLALDSTTIHLSGVQRGPDPAGRIKVLNTGPGGLPYSVTVKTASGGDWLSVSPASGTATLSTPANVAVTAAIGSLVSGTYAGMVSVSGSGSTINIPVNFTVSKPNAVLLQSQTGLSFTSAVKGSAPLPQNFGILNVGQGSLSWTASATTLSGGNWLKVGNTSGTVARAYLDVNFVEVSVDPTGLSAGTYYGKIDITAPANNSPGSVTVVFTVLPEGVNPGPEVRPSGLIFTGISGISPSPQDIQIGSASGQIDAYVTRTFGQTYSYAPSSSAVFPNQATNMRVYPDFSSLTPGTIEKAGIAFQFQSNGSFSNVQVLTVVAPSTGFGPQNSLRAEPQAGCGNSTLSIVFRSPVAAGSTFQAVVGQPTTIEVGVTDQCGNKIGPGLATNNAQVSATITGESGQINFTHIGDGIWRTSWRPVRVAAVTSINLAAIVNLPFQSGTAVLSGTVTNSATPAVAAGGVVHGASALAGLPVAPGSLITIYGLNLADRSEIAPGVPYPLQLCGGTQVRMGVTTLPILYCSANQINVQVPYDVPVDTDFQVSVQRSSALSTPEYLPVAQAEPGIFTDNQQGTGQGKISHADGTEASPSAPAAIDETVVIYCSGLGQVSPAVDAGKPAPLQEPLARTVNPVTVTIGGKPAAVSFAGLTPGYSGLYQVNAVVPKGIAAGNTVDVVVQVAGQSSPPVTMAVR